jgi:regulator of PEP synthase PpsR (kinase-PPPase family)
MADTKIENMKENRLQKTPKTKYLNFVLPEELIKRVNTICAEKEMSVQDFVMDAIIEKLQLAYKERRKKPRL